MDAAEYAERWLTAKATTDDATGALKGLVADVAVRLEHGDRTEIVSTTMNALRVATSTGMSTDQMNAMWLAIALVVLAEKGWHNERDEH